MKLLDSDKIVDFIDKHSKAIDESYEKTYTLDDIQEYLDAMPVDYDVDSVVAELEEWTFEADVIMPRSRIIKNNKLISSGNAIDIVRKGGIDE